MLKTLTAAAIALATVTGVTTIPTVPAHAGVCCQYGYPNGISFNGLNFNGINFNGFSINGFSINGMKLNGMKLNSMKLYGARLSGAAVPGSNNIGGLRVIAVELPAGH